MLDVKNSVRINYNRYNTGGISDGHINRYLFVIGCMDKQKIELEINSLYHEILKRNIDPLSLSHLTSAMMNGSTNLGEIKKMILNSPECQLVNPYAAGLINEKEPLSQQGFFDKYSDFQISSKTGQDLNRLNRRYEIIIDQNMDKIENARILDIASHDGRWSFAALRNGAKYVLGIEGRQHLINNARSIFQKYKIPNNQYKFICGDIHDEITKLKPNEFDIVFCLGFFYHTAQHEFLISQIKRLNPKYLILDSFVTLSDKPIIELRLDDTKQESDRVGKLSKAIVGFHQNLLLN